jgi:hypothetical protein
MRIAVTLILVTVAVLSLIFLLSGTLGVSFGVRVGGSLFAGEGFGSSSRVSLAISPWQQRAGYTYSGGHGVGPGEHSAAANKGMHRSADTRPLSSGKAAARPLMSGVGLLTL